MLELVWKMGAISIGERSSWNGGEVSENWDFKIESED